MGDVLFLLTTSVSGRESHIARYELQRQMPPNSEAYFLIMQVHARAGSNADGGTVDLGVRGWNLARGNPPVGRYPLHSPFRSSDAVSDRINDPR